MGVTIKETTLGKGKKKSSPSATRITEVPAFVDDISTMVKPWIPESHFKQLLDQGIDLKKQVITRLRSHESATDLLQTLNDVMYRATQVAKMFKYTNPGWQRDLATLDYHLVALADINEMLEKHEWPVDRDNRPVRLSTYLDSVLWY